MILANKIILTIIIVSCLTVGIAEAFGEEFEYSTTFLKPENATFHSGAGYWSEPESNGIDYNIQLHFSMENPEEFIADIEKQFEEIVEKLIEENVLPEPEPEVEPTPEPRTLPFFEEMKKDLIDECAEGKCKPSEVRLLEVLTSPNTFCYDGDKNSVEIQSEGFFIDPHMTFNKTDNYDYQKQYWLGELALNEMRCRADVTLDEEVHSEYHKNKSFIPFNAKQNLIPEWRANVTASYGISYDKLSNADFERSQENAKNLICYNDLYGNQFKKQMECPEDSLYVPTEYDYDYQGIESQLNTIPDLNVNSKWIAYQKYQQSNGMIAEIPSHKKTSHGNPTNWNVYDFANHFNVSPEELQEWLESQN